MGVIFPVAGRSLSFTVNDEDDGASAALGPFASGPDKTNAFQTRALGKSAAGGYAIEVKVEYDQTQRQAVIRAAVNGEERLQWRGDPADFRGGWLDDSRRIGLSGAGEAVFHAMQLSMDSGEVALLSPTKPLDRARRAAESLLLAGARLTLRTPAGLVQVESVEELPDESFEVLAVDLSGGGGA